MQVLKHVVKDCTLLYGGREAAKRLSCRPCTLAPCYRSCPQLQTTGYGCPCAAAQAAIHSMAVYTVEASFGALHFIGCNCSEERDREALWRRYSALVSPTGVPHGAEWLTSRGKPT